MLLSQTNHSYDDREDIIAETFAKVLKKIPKYEIRDVDFAARLTRIASNANIDFFRKKDRRVSSFEFDDVQKYANIKSNNHTIIDILEYEESKRKLQI